MTVHRDAQVQLTLADFANTDPQGKLNVIGGGIQFLGMDPSTGGCAPFTLVVFIQVPVRHAGTVYALSIELHDRTTGALVQMPGPDGQLQALRAQQAITVSTLQVPPPFATPDDALVSNTTIMGFPNGLPLQAGHAYEWRVQIDGQTRNWWYRFHILAPAPGIIFGGPAGPSDIPGVRVDAPEDDSTGQSG